MAKICIPYKVHVKMVNGENIIFEIGKQSYFFEKEIENNEVESIDYFTSREGNDVLKIFLKNVEIPFLFHNCSFVIHEKILGE